MPTVAEFRETANCRHAERPQVRGGYYDPEALIEQGLSIEAAFDRMANAETDNVMKGVYLEMAAVFRRAVNDVHRIWRDAN